MTRLEQLKKKEEAKAQAIKDTEAALLKALADLRGAKREASAEVKEEERKQTNKRRYHVGALVDEAGLFALDNATLKELFTVLNRARDIPDLPQVLLEALGDWLLAEEQASVPTLADQVAALVDGL